MCPFSKTYVNIHLLESEYCLEKKVRANELPGIKSINSNNEPILTNNL